MNGYVNTAIIDGKEVFVDEYIEQNGDKLHRYGEGVDQAILYRGDSDEVKYKGDVSNNEFTGFGETYDDDGKLYFRGHFVNGDFEGYGCLFKSDGDLEYNGYFKNCEFDGTGTFYPDHDENGDTASTDGLFYIEGPNYYKYVGDFKYGERNGSGKEYNESGQLLFVGDFKDDERHGLGATYDLKTGKPIGTHTWENGQLLLKNMEA